ncbi:hypothetical protein ES319_A03G216500v1, partial [Gossypium barbadense]
MAFSLLIRPQQYVSSPLIPFGPLTSIYTSMIMFICNTYLHILKKVPKGYFAVYVGENQKRFVIPVSFLSRPLFQDLLG